MMFDIIITQDPIIIVDNESTDPGPMVDSTPDTRGTNTIVMPTKAMIAPLGKLTRIPMACEG